MSHWLSEPDSPAAPKLTNPGGTPSGDLSASYYDCKIRGVGEGSTASLKANTGGGSVAGPIMSQEPSSMYTGDIFTYPDYYTKPAQGTTGTTVEYPSNDMSRMAEANMGESARIATVAGNIDSSVSIPRLAN